MKTLSCIINTIRKMGKTQVKMEWRTRKYNYQKKMDNARIGYRFGYAPQSIGHLSPLHLCLSVSTNFAFAVTTDSENSWRTAISLRLAYKIKQHSSLGVGPLFLGTS